MKWIGRRASTNVEDRRAAGPGRVMVGGGIGTILVIVIGLMLGADPMTLLEEVAGAGPRAAVPAGHHGGNPADDEAKQFVSVVLADTEDVWGSLFAQEMGVPYEEPVMVIFRGAVQSACGFASAATGPFYCPVDRKVYLDLGFFDELRDRFGAPGDFAVAYVLAHEVGHHVQRLMGITEKVHGMRRQLDDRSYNRLSVRLELQADYLAGVWAHHAQRSKRILDPGDVEEALGAAAAVGDDRLQKQAQGYVVPDAFTHGTSAQRIRWFRKGFETGDTAGMRQLFDLPDDAL